MKMEIFSQTKLNALVKQPDERTFPKCDRIKIWKLRTQVEKALLKLRSGAFAEKSYKAPEHIFVAGIASL